MSITSLDPWWGWAGVAFTGLFLGSAGGSLLSERTVLAGTLSSALLCRCFSGKPLKIRFLTAWCWSWASYTSACRSVISF